MKINKVVTALGNPIQNLELKKRKINIVGNDIQYKEGIIEYLQENKNVKFLVIDEKIPGNISTDKLIYEIKKINKKIKIILITEGKTKANVYKLIKSYDKEEIIKIINSQDIYNKTQIPLQEVFKQNTKEAEITTILGTNGIGKSIFSILLASEIKNKKILIIDFDILNNNLHTLFGIKSNHDEIKEKLKNQDPYTSYIDIQDLILHTKSNIDIVSGINILFSNKKQPTPSRIRNLILKVKKEYDNILIDTSSETLIDYTKELIKVSNNTIFISGANILEIRKTERLLEIYNKEWNISKSKINLVFNKYTNKSIDDEVLKRVFKKYNILGKIKLSDYYDLAINKNTTKIPQIKREIEAIQKRFKIQQKKQLKIRKIKKAL